MAGKVWKFGDDINTDVLAPGIYMKSPIEELASHCLDAIDPSFAKEVKPGDVVVGGSGFGTGSSREQAAQALRILGVSAVVAKSFGGIFYRNAFNLGLLVVASPDADRIEAGHDVEVRPEEGVIVNLTTGEELPCDKVPSHLLELIDDGGLVPHLEKRFAREREARP